MKTSRPSRTSWPTTAQRLLLRAALASGSEAAEAWTTWKSSVDVKRLDDGSKRMLPLLAFNLERQGVQDPLLPAFTMLRRLFFAENAARLREAAEALRALHDAAVDTLVLKGAAHASLHYPDQGLRPMADVDILVPTSRRQEAIAALGRAGWMAPTVPDRTLATLHAVGVRHPEGRELDLHWHVLMECCDPHADDEFWAAAVPVTVGGVSTRTLDPADQVLHACVHGARWDAVPSFRWIADCAMVLRSTRVDWDRLVEQARRCDLVLPLVDALTVLGEVARVQIPAGVLQTLRATPTSRWQRIEHAVRVRPPGLGGTLPRHLCQYWRRTRPAPWYRAVLGLPRYLQHAYGLEQFRELPATLLGKLRRQVQRATAWR